MTTPTNIVEKIKKLLALSKNNPNENEAASAAAMVQDLLQKFNLDMAEISFAHAKSGPSVKADTGKREKTAHTKSAMYKYQRDLMEALARNNFCMHWINKQRKADPKGKDGFRMVDTHILLGREENVIATQITYDYLVETMDNLLPYTGMQKRGKEALLWLAGCTERLVERLNEQRNERERASQRQKEDTMTATPTADAGALVVLRDVYGTEEELNNDARWGYEAGTTTKRRLEREELSRKERELTKAGMNWNKAYYVARGLPVPPEVETGISVTGLPVKEAKPETDAQRRKREEREERESRKYWEQRSRERAKREERESHPAYQSGKQRGSDIGLDTQVKGGGR